MDEIRAILKRWFPGNDRIADATAELDDLLREHVRDAVRDAINEERAGSDW